MKLRFILPAAMAITGLAACDRSEPPVQKLEKAAEEAVGEVTGEAQPEQADGPFAPRDDCSQQPGAEAFVAQIRNAVELRDAAAFAALAAEDVRLDFGGGGGQTTLVSRLGEDDGPLWSKLDELMTLGCSSDGTTLEFPYYFSQEFPGDPMQGMVVTGEDEPLLAEPRAEAEALTTLDWAGVEAVPTTEQSPSGFTRVIWRDPAGAETTGFVRSDRLRSWIDFRLGAARRNDRWRITHFVTGD